MMSIDMTGRVAIVTGASRGIGLAAARSLRDAGAQVVVTSRTEAGAAEAAASIGEGAAGFAAHATDSDRARACVEWTVENFGRLDVLVNNAGINPSYGPLLDQDYARYSKTMDVNLWAPLMWTQLAVEAWMGSHGGSVVNTTSIGGMAVGTDIGVYNMSKAALIHMTRHLGVELGPGIRVNSVAPGTVRTRLAEGLWVDREEALASQMPMRRIGEPDDIGAAILFLASDLASWITGETLIVDGGQMIGALTALDRKNA